ncbi:MAG TPA: glycosyltransferase [Burkholderiaceae bacterium]|jgi:GT2 family glycosyltransferase
MTDISQLLSVVVLTHNRSAELQRTLEKMLALPERPAIVVVDNASFDFTSTLVKTHFPQVKLISLRENIGAAARNIGVQRVQTPYVAFCDDDTWWEEGSLVKAIELMESYPNIAVLCARVLVGPENKEDPTSIEMAHSPLPTENLPGPALLGFLAGASVVRRQAFIEAGGYEPKFFIGGEEDLLTLDLAANGWHIVYVPQLVVHHYPSLQRNVDGRKKILIRNALWVAWMRLPFLLALQQTFRILRSAYQSHVFSAGFFSAMRALPWVIKRRQTLPPEVIHLYRQLHK